MSLRRYINRMIDEQPNRVPGSAVFLTPSLDMVPTALLNNAEHNGIVHEHVVLVKIHTVGVPHVEDAERITVEKLRLGFVAVTARYGYQDVRDVVAALELATRQGLELDLDRTSYYVDHVTILPTGRARMAGWETPLRPPAPELDPGRAVVPHPARPRVRGRRVRRTLNLQLPRYHEALESCALPGDLRPGPLDDQGGERAGRVLRRHPGNRTRGARTGQSDCKRFDRRVVADHQYRVHRLGEQVEPA